jgi:primosomal protein N' (replication factor Y)
VRRGYAPTVVCRDCGTTVTDEYGRTLSLSISNGVRIFRSADGKVIEDIGGKKILCKNCGSWNLTPLGIGIERIEEELLAAYPDTPILRIDADTVSAKTRHELASHDGAHIVIGTELMLPWLSPETPFDFGIIASADSLLGLPFWRSRERFVRVGYMLAERSKELVVVTRQPEETALTALTSPADSGFWKEETGLRKMLQYPPYGTLIVFHAEGTAERITQAHDFITKACAPHTIVRLPDRQIAKNLLRATSVLHLPAEIWPDAAISKKLSHLPPYVRLQIDAETLW